MSEVIRRGAFASGLFAFVASVTGAAFGQGMTLPGKLDVGSSGAAVYTVPIAVPPGTAGMVPSLQLSYNSQGGNGLVGLGWSLDGLPSIGRCPQTVMQDGARGRIGYNNNDRFCLDGQRLTVVNGAYGSDGAQYRTEIDSYSRIFSRGTSGNGPAWFEVQTKSGQVMQFGNTADSRIPANSSGTARSWALNKVTDTKGNYFTVTYTNDAANGQAYPTRIDYTGNAAAGLAAYNSVRFVYAARPDISAVYSHGSLVRATVRLANIQTYSGNTLVSDYRLAYQAPSFVPASRVTSITLCSGTNVCLPATSFGLSPAGNEPFVQTGQILPINFGSPLADTHSPIGGDFNGDGRTDFVVIGQTHIFSFMGNGDGTFTYHGQQALPIATPLAGAAASYYSIVPGDFNADGRADFALVGGNHQISFLGNGNGTFTILSQTYGADFGTPPWDASAVIPGDYNGDGRTDYIITSNNIIHTFFSNGNGTFTPTTQVIGPSFGRPRDLYATAAGDFDNDGRSDFAFVGGNMIYGFLSNGDGTYTGTSHASPANFGSPPTAYVIASGDFNGDGKSDYALVGGNMIYGFLSKGDGSFLETSQTLAPNFGSPPSAYNLIGGDFNGDGRTDFALIGGNVAYGFQSNGDGSFTQTGQILGASFSSPPSTYYSVIEGDFNGDGKGDYVLLNANVAYGFLSSGLPAGLITSITSGMGLQTNITYLPMTNGTVYAKDGNAGYPTQDVIGPGYVVSRVDEPNGLGGFVSAAYSYGGAKLDLRGLGLLGFRWMRVRDLQTNILQETIFRQDFPYVGNAYATSKSLGSLTLNQASTTYQVKNWSGTTTISSPTVTNAPYRVAVEQTLNSGTDLNGSGLPTVTTNFQYDGYGNATQVTVATPDGNSKTTTNTYANTVNATSWHLGRLTAATVTSQGPAPPPPGTPPTADLTVAKSHGGSFARGQTGIYTLSVINVGTASTSGAVTVTDTLPSGLTAAALSGTGWSCTLATVTCTRSDALIPGASYPVITLTVSVAYSAAASVTNVATVSGGGDTSPGNNSASDPTATVPAPVVPGQQDFIVSGTYSFTVPPHNTLAVQVWGGGGAGGTCQLDIYGVQSGGSSSFASVVAGGGIGGGPDLWTLGGGGSASGGDTNINGNPATTQTGGYNGYGGNAPNGGIGGRNGDVSGFDMNGLAPGGGGGGGSYYDENGWGPPNPPPAYGGGGSGAYAQKSYSAGALSLGSTVTVVVGAGGASMLGCNSQPASGTSGAGASGRVFLSWN